MIAPRGTALVAVLLLIAVLSLAGIGLLALFSPTATGGPGVEHADGRIVAVQSNTSFVLQTANGQRLRFLCEERCQLALQHIERHMREKAHTDVYYLEGKGGGLIAIQVD
jgi:hypothetical protein